MIYHSVLGQENSYLKNSFASVLSIQSISKKASLCSATLLEPYLAITAARCINILQMDATRPVSKHFVAVGGILNASKWDPGYQAIPISKAIKHPNYKGAEADIAVLIFKKPFSKSKVVKLPFNKVVIPEGANVQIVGWTSDGHLGYENCVVEDTKTCQEDGIEGIDFSEHICIGRSVEQFVEGLTVDPGSPVFYRNTLVGIMSKSDPSYPGADEAYLDILAYEDFIMQYLPGEKEDPKGIGNVYRSQFPNSGLRLEVSSWRIFILRVVSTMIMF